MTVATPEEWLDVAIDSELAAQQAKQDAAKLIVTFTTGVAAALTGPALQEDGGMDALKWLSAITLVGALVLAVAVFVLDQLERPSLRWGTTDQTRRPEATPAAGLYQLRLSAVTAVLANIRLLEKVKKWFQTQIAVAFLGCVLSIWSLAT